MTRTRSTIMIAAIAFVCAVAGVFVGRAVVPAQHAQGSELHELLHHGLHLDAGQQARLDALERRFAIRRRVLEMDMRAENARLAEAIDLEHGEGPRVAAAVDASHRTMGTLQKETLAHVFAMRQVLRPEQVGAFDRAVTASLTPDAR